MKEKGGSDGGEKRWRVLNARLMKAGRVDWLYFKAKQTQPQLQA